MLPNLSSLTTNKVSKTEDSKQKVKAFVIAMNYYAKQLNLSSTRFANPHGLPHHEGKSNAADVAKLCSYCIED